MDRIKEAIQSSVLPSMLNVSSEVIGTGSKDMESKLGSSRLLLFSDKGVGEKGSNWLGVTAFFPKTEKSMEKVSAAAAVGLAVALLVLEDIEEEEEDSSSDE